MKEFKLLYGIKISRYLILHSWPVSSKEVSDCGYTKKACVEGNSSNPR